MQDKNVNLFVYGSLKDTYIFQSICGCSFTLKSAHSDPNVLFAELALLSGYRRVSPDNVYFYAVRDQAAKLEGFVVFCAGAARHNAFILELLARDDNPETMRALLRPTFRELRTQGTGYVWASFPADSRATTALKQLGFKSWGTRLWNIDMIIATDPRKKSCPELDLKSWDFSLGDWLCF